MSYYPTRYASSRIEALTDPLFKDVQSRPVGGQQLSDKTEGESFNPRPGRPKNKKDVRVGGTRGMQYDLSGIPEAVEIPEDPPEQQETDPVGAGNAAWAAGPAETNSESANFLNPSAQRMFQKSLRADMFKAFLPYMTQEQATPLFNQITGFNVQQEQKPEFLPSFLDRLGPNQRNY